MLIATAGHVDHGKTSLVKALSGVDTDRLPEEKARGLTIDLGFAHTDIGNGCRVSFIDVPGHERFVRNMVAGVSGIDIALIVIAADDGVMPQTIEHLAILDYLGVEQGVIVITKADRVDVTQVKKVEAEALSLVSGTRLATPSVIVASGISGEGLDNLRQHLQDAATTFRQPTEHGYFRMAVDRSFSVPGIGLVATGTIISGHVKKEDRLVVTPGDQIVRVRGLRSSDQDVKEAGLGVRCAINLASNSLNEKLLRRGSWLTAPELVQPSNRIDVRLKLSSSESKPMKHWAPAHFHHAASDIPCRVALLEARSLEPGESCLAQILLDQPTLSIFDDNFILRDQSARRTIGGGTVIDPLGQTRGRSRPERLEQLNILGSADNDLVFDRLLDHAEGGIDLKRFSVTRNISIDELSDLTANNIIVENRAFSERRWHDVKLSIVESLNKFHANSPEDQGLQEEALQRRLSKKLQPVIIQCAIRNLIKSGEIARTGSALHVPGHKAQASDAELVLWRRLEPVLADGGIKPARELELVEQLNLPQKTLQQFLSRAGQLGLIYRVSKNRVYLPAAAREVAEIAAELANNSNDGQFDASAYRDRSGIGRNLTIEVLEFLDRCGLTRRKGNSRSLIASPEEIFPIKSH